MLIPTDSGTFDISITWLEPDLVEIRISERRSGVTHYCAPITMTPGALSQLGTYINRTLCL